jgi:iron complex transport system substrate-binding protein
MKKFLLCVLSAILCMTLVFSSVACSGKGKTQTEGQVTVTDQAGRTVTLEKPAQKIVSFGYNQTYAVIALGLADRLIGIEAKANQRPIYSLAAPELLDLPNVGSQKQPNIEAAIALEPDLVLMAKSLQSNVSAFEAVGIPVAICYPESQALLEEEIKMIASLCGVPGNADALIKYYDDTYKKVEKITSKFSDAEKPVVYMGAVSSYLSTSPKNMYQADLIAKAGAVNAAKDIDGDKWTDVSYEQLLAMDPDIIILPSEASYSIDDVLNDKQLASVKAVKNKAVYKMPYFEALDSPVPSGVLGTLYILAKAHGEKYSLDTFKKDLTDFYKKFYGFDADTSNIN